VPLTSDASHRAPILRGLGEGSAIGTPAPGRPAPTSFCRLEALRPRPDRMLRSAFCDWLCSGDAPPTRVRLERDFVRRAFPMCAMGSSR